MPACGGGAQASASLPSVRPEGAGEPGEGCLGKTPLKTASSRERANEGPDCVLSAQCVRADGPQAWRDRRPAGVQPGGGPAPGAGNRATGIAARFGIFITGPPISGHLISFTILIYFAEPGIEAEYLFFNEWIKYMNK